MNALVTFQVLSKLKKTSPFNCTLSLIKNYKFNWFSYKLQKSEFKKTGPHLKQV